MIQRMNTPPPEMQNKPPLLDRFTLLALAAGVALIGFGAWALLHCVALIAETCR